MARSGMAYLITDLRGSTNAGTADYSISGVDYWSDDQLQDKLDLDRTDLNRVLLKSEPEYNGGTVVYFDYYSPVGMLETADSGGTAFRIEDANGSAIGTALYTPDYRRGVFRFDADQSGSARYLRARAYDLNKAAARVWGDIAAHFSGRFDVITDNHNLKRSQVFKSALEMAESYDRRAGMQTVRTQRSDLR